MAVKKNKVEEPSLFDALDQLEKETGISVDYMMERVEKAISTACNRNYGNDDITIERGPNNELKVYLNYTVIDDDYEHPDFNKHIYADIALEEYGVVREPGQKVAVEVDTKQFGRVAANTARQTIRQGIRDSEKGQMLKEFKSKNQELVSAVVYSIDPVTGKITVQIGKHEVVLPEKELIGTEKDQLKVGSHLQVYVVDVKESEKGSAPRLIISRTHADFVKRLFENEVPEIHDGKVEIKSISREAGSRTKMAVKSHDADIDAVGACIGTRGMRVSAIVEELGGEKIDIVEYSEDPAKFIAAALAPASVVGVEIIDADAKSCKATVPDNQLSLAIGNKGQNARLAAKLTGWKIDIRPESGFYGE